MATYTSEIELKKPDEEDFFDIADFNYNSDILDEAIGNRLKKNSTYTVGNIVKFTTDGEIADTGKAVTDFMESSANYETVGADQAGLAQAVQTNLTSHTADSTKHFTSDEREKLAIAYTTDDIVVSSTQPTVLNGRIWIKVE